MAFFNIRQWIDRVSQFPNRRTLTNVEDPTDVKTYDLSRAEGEITTQGTAITGANLNDLEGRIASAFTSVEQAMPEANPAAEATGSLIKIKINGTVYEIEGGGEPQTGTIEDVAIASFSDGADDVPVSELIVDIEARQDLHGYDKPWVGGAGKNKLEVTATTQTVSGVTFMVNNDGTIQVSGTNTSDDSVSITIGNVTLPQGTYTISTGNPTGAANDTHFLNIDPSKTGAHNNWNVATTYTFTDSAETTHTIRIYIRPRKTVNALYKPMIEEGSTATAYEPYSNICPITGFDSGVITVDNDQITNTYTVDFGQTVYGGLLDVTSGKLTVTWISNIVVPNNVNNNGSDNTMQLYKAFYYRPSGASSANCICDMFHKTTIADAWGIIVRTNSNGVEFNIPFSALGVTAEDDDNTVKLQKARQWFTDNPTMLVYELATPIEIQLTPVQVKTLLNNNNIFADTGDINKLVYFKTGCENIAKLIEAYSEKDGTQTVLLEATDWDSTTNTITVDVAGVTATSNQEILPLRATSAANIANNKALQACNLMDYGQAAGQITLYAENIPSVDLSIRVIVRA